MKRLFAALTVLSCLCSAALAWDGTETTSVALTENRETVEAEPSKKPSRAAEPAGGPSVSAASAILMDAGSGRILYAKDAHTRRLIASTTKLMTALVAVESTPHLEKTVTMTMDYVAEGSSMYLKLGEEISLHDLLYGLLLSSGNDAALAIAGLCAGDAETFVGWMNEWAEELGMTDSHFANPNGLDDKEHYSTAYDMALLAQAVLQNETVAGIVATKTAHVAGRSLTNHNKLLWRYEGCIGMKTGYTEAAGRTLVSAAERDGQTLICVTLNDSNDWEDHARLLDYGFAHFKAHPLARAGKVFRRIPVSGSLLPQVGVVTASDVSYPLAPDERVRVKVDLPIKIQAPVRAGTIAGRLTFSVNGEAVGETYLLYAANVPDNAPRPSLLRRVRAALALPGQKSASGRFLARWEAAMSPSVPIWR